MTRAAVLCRVSTKKQVDGTSLDEQERLCCAESDRLGWEVVYVGRDEGISGGELDRDALQTVLDLVRQGAVEAVIVHHQDRLARDEFVRYMAEREMKDSGVIYRPLNLPAEVDPFDEKEGEMTAGMFGIMAQYQRRQNQWRAANGQRAKAASQRWPGGAAPYGWQIEGKGRDARPVPCQPERVVISLATDAMLNDGMTTGQVAALLNGLGYTGRKGGTWTHQRVRRTLENESLTGVVYWGKPTRKHGHSTKLKPDGAPKYGEPTRIDLADPPLTRERWGALWQVLQARGYGKKADAKPYPLSGLITGVCGGKHGGVYRKDRDLRQYRCPNSKWVAGNPPTCDCARINADWLEGLVWSEVLAVLADPDRLMRMAADYLGLRAEASQPEAHALGEVESAIARLEKARVERAVEALKAGVPADVLAAAVAQIEQEVAALRIKREGLLAWSANQRAEQDRALSLARLAEQARTTLPNMPLAGRGEVLRLLRVSVTLRDVSGTPGVLIRGSVPGGGSLSSGGPNDGGYPGDEGPRSRTLRVTIPFEIAS